MEIKSSLRIALIGCGRIGNRHAEHIQRQAQLVAVCDTDKSKREALSQKMKCASFASLDDFLTSKPEVDLISICTPNGLHSEQSIACLEAGYHVLCEKPLGIDVYQCGEMLKAAEKSNRRLFAIKQNRFNPPVKAVKDLIEEGRLGAIQNVQLSCFWNRNEDYYANSWKGSSDLDGGTLFTQFSHFVDLLYWLVGDVKTAVGFSRNYQHQGIIDFEDTGVVALDFYNGAIGSINYTVNSYKKNMEGSLTLFGEKGTVKIGGQYLNELEYQSIEGDPITDLPAGNKANSYGTYQGSMSNHDKVYENVIDVLSRGGAINTSSFEGLKTVEIIDKIYQAIR